MPKNYKSGNCSGITKSHIQLDASKKFVRNLKKCGLNDRHTPVCQNDNKLIKNKKATGKLVNFESKIAEPKAEVRTSFVNPHIADITKDLSVSLDLLIG